MYANLMSLFSRSVPSVGPVPREMPGIDVASLGFYLPLRRMIIFFTCKFMIHLCKTIHHLASDIFLISFPYVSYS